MKTAYILMGIPGSGKSTFTEEKIPEAIVCSADHFFLDEDGHYTFESRHLQRAHAQCLQAFVDELQRGRWDVVVDNTNTSIATVAPYIALAKAYGYEVECIAFTSTHIDECMERGLHDVPRPAVENMARKLGGMLFREWPSFWPKVKYDDAL